jgi:hypothetical protein
MLDWRIMTPFGKPVVPPVYMNTRSIPLRADEAPLGAAVAAVSYGIAHLGHGPLPSSTHNHNRTVAARARTRPTVSVKPPWNTTAAASASFHR